MNRRLRDYIPLILIFVWLALLLLIWEVQTGWSSKGRGTVIPHATLAPAVAITATPRPTAQPTSTFGPPAPPSWLPGTGGRYSFPTRSELAAYARKQKGCGHLISTEHWKGNRVSLTFQRCVITARFSVKRPSPPPLPTIVPTRAPEPTSTPTPWPTMAPPSDPTAYLLSLIENERQSLGIAPLSLNSQLSTCALAHSKRMASEGGISHDGWPTPDLCVPFSHGAGQNVGQDFDPVLQGVLSDFMLMMGEGNQPLGSCLGGHDCSITYRGYSSVGIGIYDDGSRVWVTETFVG